MFGDVIDDHERRCVPIRYNIDLPVSLCLEKMYVVLFLVLFVVVINTCHSNELKHFLLQGYICVYIYFKTSSFRLVQIWQPQKCDLNRVFACGDGRVPNLTANKRAYIYFAALIRYGSDMASCSRVWSIWLKCMNRRSNAVK